MVYPEAVHDQSRQWSGGAWEWHGRGGDERIFSGDRPINGHGAGERDEGLGGRNVRWGAAEDNGVDGFRSGSYRNGDFFDLVTLALRHWDWHALAEAFAGKVRVDSALCGS